jgi:hypothetical protein
MHSSLFVTVRQLKKQVFCTKPLQYTCIVQHHGLRSTFLSYLCVFWPSCVLEPTDPGRTCIREGGSINLLAAANITMHFVVRTERMACLRHSELVFVVTRLLHAFTGFCEPSIPAPWLTSRSVLLPHFSVIRYLLFYIMGLKAYIFLLGTQFIRLYLIQL